MRSSKARVGLVGARGYVGQELVRALKRSPYFEIAFVSSRTKAGSPVGEIDLAFEDLSAEGVAAKGADAVVLALSNGQAAPVVAALEGQRPETVIVDVSADHRFHDGWVYGLPELFRASIVGARRIANPGCYATAAGLVVRPVAPLLAGLAQCFGVSGYSGAGTTPSKRNDVEALRDNLMPYQLVGHVHEREITRYAGPAAFMPHAAQFFRGISMTVSLPLVRALDAAALKAIYTEAYGDEPLVSIVDEIPLVRDAVNRPGATIGGFAVEPASRRAVVVATLDNLLKGAATQAVQNLNLAFGFPERAGIEPWPS